MLKAGLKWRTDVRRNRGLIHNTCINTNLKYMGNLANSVGRKYPNHAYLFFTWGIQGRRLTPKFPNQPKRKHTCLPTNIRLHKHVRMQAQMHMHAHALALARPQFHAHALAHNCAHTCSAQVGRDSKTVSVSFWARIPKHCLGRQGCGDWCETDLAHLMHGMF